MAKVGRVMQPLSLGQVLIKDSFWAPRLETNRTVTIPHAYNQCEKTGRFNALRAVWDRKMKVKPQQFWDPYIAKWMEAASYSLAVQDDPELQQQLDRIIDWFALAQARDGYINSYYQKVDPWKRWTNLRDMHELYCAGHLMEAAVAHHEATGKKKFLDVMCRYADYIYQTFGRGNGQKRGYPGHEEIELALVRLFRATGRERYIFLAEHFLNERGRKPHYFDIEARLRGDDPNDGEDPAGRHAYTQAHLPVREQDTAEGHAVRACYLYAGMADVAAETGDASLMKACRRLWKNIVEKRMYIHGGVGSSHIGERFTSDYDLPNEDAYAETCAAIGLVFFAHRMLQAEGIKVGLVSGKESDVIRARARALDLDPVRCGCRDKLKAVEEILAETGLKAEEVAFAGDDLFDMAAMKAVGLSFSVPNARQEVKDAADYVTETPGGKGAAREMAEIIMGAKDSSCG